MEEQELAEVLVDLLKLPSETEWVEFKHNNENPEEIGEYISAISNSAALEEKEFGWIAWGVTNPPDSEFVGTTFYPKEVKVGAEELENWLTHMLSPQVDFRIFQFLYDEKNAVMMRIPAATHLPVNFKQQSYIRVGSYKKKLNDCPAKAKSLWAIFCDVQFEKGVAKNSLSADEVVNQLSVQFFFDLMKQNLPDTKGGILSRFSNENLIKKRGLKYDITNFGALLFAKELSTFGDLKRKALRVVTYSGTDRTEAAVRERVGSRGYACGFENAIQYINSQLPDNEHIGVALRTSVKVYPELAIRELLANALIHQDLDAVGTSPFVEIFSDRIEISNPGKPLIDVQRFIDTPPQSRNESLAALMRRIGICEERGGGIDKVIARIEFYQLPPPDFRVTANHTIAVLFRAKPLGALTQQERVRGCYQHCCLQHVSNRHMTNASLRKRFDIKDENSAIASRIISDTVEVGLVRQFDPSNLSKKHTKYVPFWA